MAELQSLLDRVEKANGPDEGLDLDIMERFAAPVQVPFTDSMDSAVFLVEWLLPKHHWRAGHGLGMQAVAHINRAFQEEKGITGFGANPPLALLSALLRTLIAKEEAKG